MRDNGQGTVSADATFALVRHAGQTSKLGRRETENPQEGRRSAKADDPTSMPRDPAARPVDGAPAQNARLELIEKGVRT
jgi:hypothetical protein